jgi:hypothetical protein
VKPLTGNGLAALILAQEFCWGVFPVYEPNGRGGCSCDQGDHCERPAKHPRNAVGFKGATTSAEQIGEWWGDRWPNANVGLYPGSAGLIVVDIDGPSGEEAARKAGALDVGTLEVITSRGRHRYFRLPGGVVIPNVARTELDVRAHNGYTLAPPSVHASGFQYEWRGSLDNIAEVPSGVIEELMRPRQRPSPNRPFTPPAAIPLSAIDPFTERRILKYADCIGYGLSDGRKSAAYRLTCFIRYDVGLADHLVWECVSAWNRGNAPPLEDDVLGRVFSNALKYAQGAA